MSRYPSATSAFAAALAMSLMAPVMADDALTSYGNINDTYGVVPPFFEQVPRTTLPDLWGAFTAHQMNPELGMSPEQRGLVGVAMAAQTGCHACLYFHAAEAIANGATETDVLAAVEVGMATGRLDAALAAMEVTPRDFRARTDLVLWGDAATVKLRTMSPELCSSVAEQVQAIEQYCGQ